MNPTDVASNPSTEQMTCLPSGTGYSTSAFGLPSGVRRSFTSIKPGLRFSFLALPSFTKHT
ncbi:hypothetical protein PF003_g22263 [Phytophthora fragariae]|nr:hypothetical protein PF003_g22263 [Phytophthora fragariae]